MGVHHRIHVELQIVPEDMYVLCPASLTPLSFRFLPLKPHGVGHYLERSTTGHSGAPKRAITFSHPEHNVPQTISWENPNSLGIAQHINL